MISPGASNFGAKQGDETNVTVPAVKVVRPSNNVTLGFVIPPEKSGTWYSILYSS